MQRTLDEIYEAIFKRADVAFPELELESYQGGWRSSKKLDGSSPRISRKEKTVITRSVPNRLLEQGGESLTFWDYIQRRDNLSDGAEVYQRLCKAAGLWEENGGSKSRMQEAVKSAKDSTLFEAANNFFLKEIQSTAASNIREYLYETRKYSESDIAAMELGAITSQEALYQYLKNEGFGDQAEVKEELNLNGFIGTKHTLVIPLRSEGKLVGFSFRDINHGPDSTTPKYQNNTGLRKTSYLFNLQAEKTGEDLILVEGEFDALAAAANGIENVAAVKGSGTITDLQLGAIRKRRPRRLVLCFDGDKAGDDELKKALERLSKEAIPLYIARLPEGYDPDGYIREKGKDAFEKMLREAERVGSALPGIRSSCRSFEDLETRIRNRPDALKTGIAALDEGIRIPVGALTLVAGRTRHGKTTLMYNLLLSMAEVYPEKKFYFFSYEESEAAILLKILNRLVATDLIYSGYGSRYEGAINNLQVLESYIKAEDQDIPAIETGKRKLDSLLKAERIQVVDEPYSVEALSELIHGANSTENIGAVFLDYIQRIGTQEPRLDIRSCMVRVSDELRRLAVSTGLPLIVGAQFGREGVSRQNEDKKASKPTLQALKEAGNLEEDANTVLRIWNPAAEDESAKENVEVEVSVLKARDGNPHVTTKLIFRRSMGVIEDGERDGNFTSLDSEDDDQCKF